MSVLALLVALVLGFFPSGADSVEGSSRAAEPPSTPPPATVPGNAPPPAWVETESGSYWLVYSGYCWGPRCVKHGAVLLDVKVPRVQVRRGEVVRFHLGFQPRRVTLSFDRGRIVRLRPERTMSWRVERGGIAYLQTYTARGEKPAGSVGYAAVFTLG
jgi:hypothetical protein